MIGDIWLWLLQFCKEQTCLHEYKTHSTPGGYHCSYQECTKCGRVKH